MQYSKSVPDTETYGINVEFASPAAEALGDGFNRYGVRENDDGSIDVRFNAMEPGTRRGYDVTPEFLQRVASKEYSRVPVQLDHSKSQRANVGYIESDNIKFADGFARVQLHIPNTGSSIKEDVIADFTHEPPAINDASFAFDPDTIEVEPPEERGGAPKFVDGRLQEVSLTPFPAGYDDGGLTPAFSEAVDDAVSANGTAGNDDGPAASQLVVKQYETK